MWKTGGFHSGDSILECDSVQSVINIATFRINVLPATFGSKACVSTVSHEDTPRKTPAVAVVRGRIHLSSLSDSVCMLQYCSRAHKQVAAASSQQQRQLSIEFRPLFR